MGNLNAEPRNVRTFQGEVNHNNGLESLTQKMVWSNVWQENAFNEVYSEMLLV